MADEQRDDKIQSAAILWARYSEVAFIIPAAVVVGLLIGKLLDHWLHTHWLFIAGVIVGAVLGFVQMIRMVTRKDERSRAPRWQGLRVVNNSGVACGATLMCAHHDA
jgi:F0F1-type ATP synthase assembly protein I